MFITNEKNYNFLFTFSRIIRHSIRNLFHMVHRNVFKDKKLNNY